MAALPPAPSSAVSLTWACLDGRFAVVLTANKTVPAESTWTFSVSRPTTRTLKVVSDKTTLIPTASGGTSSVPLRAAKSIAASSTITLGPQNYEIPNGSGNVLTLQGYGGVSKSVGFSTTSWPCHRPCWLTWESVILIR